MLTIQDWQSFISDAWLISEAYHDSFNDFFRIALKIRLKINASWFLLVLKVKPSKIFLMKIFLFPVDLLILSYS